MTDAAAVHALRCACWDNGYRPVAVYSPEAQLRGIPIAGAGKRPVGKDWLQRARRDPPDAVACRAAPLARNTGIVAGEVSGLDVDVLIHGVVDQIVALIERTLGPTPLSRIGRAPKILLCYRAPEPFAKLSTAYYQMPDGSLAHFEILGDGQQFVAFGIHPDTMQPYQWLDGSPDTVPLVELPVITAMRARDLIGEAEAILEGAGGVKNSKPEPPRPDPAPKAGDFFRNVNTAALANIAAWVQSLFPTAKFQRGTGAWRVPAADLGRGFQEDLSIHPQGIRNFGPDKKVTAIDLVIEFGDRATALEAARWLCKQLGVTPESLGWRTTTPRCPIAALSSLPPL